MPKQGFRADHYQTEPDPGASAQGKITAPTYTDAAISEQWGAIFVPGWRSSTAAAFSLSPPCSRMLVQLATATNRY